MADPDRLTPDVTGEGATAASPITEDSLAGPDRGRERVRLYALLFGLLLAGAFLLRENLVWATGPTAHTVMESISTVLAAIIGGLALVRYYSRKQATFLLIGTGFLGAAILNLNHTLITSEALIDTLAGRHPGVNETTLFAWSWTAERVFLSLFLFVSLLAWRQEVRSEEDDTADLAINEVSVYGSALALTLLNLLFFENVPLSSLTFPNRLITRPGEFLPALFFVLAFVGFLGKKSWRRDVFDHWLLVSLLISALVHAGFMAFSYQRFDAMYDAAHLLKIASHVAILTGLLSSVYVTFRREGQVLGAFTESNKALAREIAERARTEQAVTESNQRLQEFLDNANDLIQSVTREGRILYVNSAWKRVLGYDDDALDRLDLFEIVRPEHRDALREEFDRVLNGEPSQRFNVEYFAADGRVVILSGSAQAQLVDGEPVATQGILRDVTEQRLAERQLAESRANLGALVENTGDSIWSVDRDHRLITYNSAFALAMEARSGQEPEVGRLPEELFPEEDLTWYEALYERTLSGERHVALRTDEVDGQLRYFELYANPIQSLEGVSGAVFFGKDVTPRVRAEEALRVAKDEAEAANKAKSDFLANMSHELRTPLNSVIGFTNILLKNKDGHLSEKDIGFLQRVLSNGTHLLALINEVLDLAKVEAGRMELVIEDVDLSELCVETVQQLEGQAKTKEGAVRLLTDVPDEVERVSTDSAKLKQVIINLIGNALKFTEEGSVTVRLETAPDGRTPTGIAVVDTGIGIPDDRLEAIFQAFQQAQAGTSRKYGGTGLGLALSRSICLLMGYDLIVESEVGEGSTFRIVLGERAEKPVREDEPEPESEQLAAEEAPATAEDFAAAAAGQQRPEGPSRHEAVGDGAATKSAALRGFKVLVVDDERDSRVLAHHYLEEFGCEVLTASGGEEGLAAAREHRPDLITLDLLMPGLNGWETLKQLKADPDLRRIPVVIISVVASEERGRLLGAVDLITKPFERDDLLRVVWRHLVRKAGGRVLVVAEPGERRDRVTHFLKDKGLEVFTTPDGPEALEELRLEVPDAMLLDATSPRVGAVKMLKRIREDRAHQGLPVIAWAGPGVPPQVRAELESLSTVVVPEQALHEQLGAVLEKIFPSFDIEEAGR
ncbi:MAG: PAS domain S-box protein [Gemmatimonadota bacterium]|nr:PAS domain S-box protein [Gemmatimonadota bacterium]